MADKRARSKSAAKKIIEECAKQEMKFQEIEHELEMEVRGKILPQSFL